MFRLAFLIALFAVASAITRRSNESEEDIRETVIFLGKATSFGQNVFIRGGVGNGEDCAPDEDPEDDPCAIPITHIELDMDTPLRDEWAGSDAYLTWGGREDNQPWQAEGTPAQWTTSDQSDAYHDELNVYGENYWMVKFDMDCSLLEDGFFDFKGFLDGQWENDIHQSICQGNAAEKPSYTSSNHIARCGYINKFDWGSSGCTMTSFE